MHAIVGFLVAIALCMYALMGQTLQCVFVRINITPNLMRLSTHYIREYYIPNNQQRRNNKKQQTRTDEGKTNICTQQIHLCATNIRCMNKKNIRVVENGMDARETKQSEAKQKMKHANVNKQL